MANHYAQPILHFYCRPCADYHLKTHPHYVEAQERSAERRKTNAKKQRLSSASRPQSRPKS